MNEFEVYRHYKGNYYIKLNEAEHSETGELMVIYISSMNGKIYARPKKMFEDMVQTSSYYGPRFCKMKKDFIKNERFI